MGYRVVLAITWILVALNLLGFLSEGRAPRKAVDGVGVGLEQLIDEGGFGSLRRGDIRRIHALLHPGDRFFVVGPYLSNQFGRPIVNAQLLLGSLLVPNVMVQRCADAEVIIVLHGADRPCTSGKPRLLLHSGVDVFRLRA